MRRFVLFSLATLVMATLPMADASARRPAPRSHSCQANARIERLSNTSYRIGGEGVCDEVVVSLTLNCKPIHRHSTYWHSHSGVTFPPSSNTSSTGTWWWGPLAGTDGDSYKTSCTGTFSDHGSTVTHTDESVTISL